MRHFPMVYQDELCTVRLEPGDPVKHLLWVTPNMEPQYNFLISKRKVDGQWIYRVDTAFLTDYQAVIAPYIKEALEENCV